MAGTTPNVHDFTDMSDDEKKSLLEMFLNRTLNVTDPSAESVDQSTSSMQLHVKMSFVQGWLRSLDMEKIVAQLIGKKTDKEILDIIFDL